MTVVQMKKWRQVETLEDAVSLIDHGVILGFNQARKLSSKLDKSLKLEIIQYLSNRMNEDGNPRLFDEILIENTLLILHHNYESEYLGFFLEQFILHPNRKSSCLRLLDYSLNLEWANTDHVHTLYPTLVTLLCELGLGLEEFNKSFPGKLTAIESLRDNFSTYLLSVSNTENEKIRLTLLYYFARIEQDSKLKPGFNKLLNRFGFSILDNLFVLLFNRKTESIALQYMFDNLIYFFGGNEGVQVILHQTFKSFMLKNPERFCLFLESYFDYFKAHDEKLKAAVELNVLFQLGSLFRVGNEYDHKKMVKSVVDAMLVFKDSVHLRDIVKSLLKQKDVRPHFAAPLKLIIRDTKVEKIRNVTARSIVNPRGRPATFLKSAPMNILDQVEFLGSHMNQLQVG
jgi:predicted Zn-dependent protease with MMP-like domain